MLHGLLRGLSLLLVPAVLVTFLPFVILCFCAHPVDDDYVLANVLIENGFFRSQELWYCQWTGKYFGIFCSTLFMRCFGLEHYWLAPLVLLAATWGALLFAVRTVGGRRLARRHVLLVASTLTAMFLARMRGPGEMFYWLTAAFEYQTANILTILLVGLLAQRQPRTRWLQTLHTIAAALVAFGAVGCTETMMVALVLGAGSWLCATLVARERPSTRQLAVIAAIGGGAALMMLAPGNESRASNFPAAHRLLPSLFAATGRGLGYATLWAVHPALIGASLLVARAMPRLARRLPPRTLGLSARNPMPLLWLLALAVACHLPAYWAMGSKPPFRAVTNIWVAFLIGWFLLALPCLWRLATRDGTRGWRDPRSGRHGLVPLARALVVVGLFAGSNVPRALVEIGPAFRIRSEHQQRLATIAAARACRATEVVLPPFTREAKTLGRGDITADASDWRNTSFAAYHGLARVVLGPPPAGR